MADTVIVDGDLALFMPNFGAAIVVPVPGTITASGKPTVQGKAVCVDGDEASVEVQGVVYMTPQYSIPGTGTLKIDALGGDQLATKVTADDTALILKGSTFNAVFEVMAPAQQPSAPSPVPDSTTSYSGSGNFQSFNILYTAT